MASITFDGQSFIIDSRRIWLVSGAIHYARVPRELWRRRIRAAKQAGLNCIETYVFWNLHEPEPGTFDFDGERDLRAFVRLIGEEGMHCILRPGPYVCAEWDMGGLPSWLLRNPNLRLREGDRGFLEACARYLGAVMEQVDDLQITAPTEALPAPPGPGNVPGEAAGGFVGGGGGPILAIQVENEWFCANEQQAEAYLKELVRYLRENGCQVPITNCNNLWQRVEGTIDTWNACEHLTSDLRQLAVVQPGAPRLVSEYWPGWFDTWAAAHHVGRDAPANLARLARILASGAQYNLYMFHGGTNFGFHAAHQVTTSYDYDAPLREAGGRGPKFAAIKRLSTFASQFHHVLAHLKPDPPHAALTPDSNDHPLTLIHQPGAQGDVVFLFRSPSDKRQVAEVTLPNGLTLPVPMDDEPAAWLLLQANLGGAIELEYTNLRPWAFLQKKMLVLFGPAGAEGVIGLEGADLHVTVPTAGEPLVQSHERLIVVVLNTEQVDAAYPWPGGLVVGSDGLDDDNQPLPLAGWKKQYRISLDGEIETVKTSSPALPTPPRLDAWDAAPLHAHVDGSADAFDDIKGPTSHEQLSNPLGYGWYRLSLGAARSGQVFAPGAADRLHVYSQGTLQGVLGVGPGATDQPASLQLAGDVVMLCDNLGRASVGQRLGQRKGLHDHLYTVEKAALGKAKATTARAPDPLELRGYVHGRRRGDRPTAERFTWTFKHQAKKPLILRIKDLPYAGVFYLNDQPIDLYEPDQLDRRATFVLAPESSGLKTGNNELTLALLAPLEGKADLGRYLQLYRVKQTLTQRARWAFAPWQPPDEAAFQRIPKQTKATGLPTWYRTRFEVSQADVPLWLEPRGLSKGQLYLNGHNVGRFWMNTAEGKAVPPQKRYYLPEPWLKTGEPNELLIFDEHGKTPSRCRLVYDPDGPY